MFESTDSRSRIRLAIGLWVAAGVVFAFDALIPRGVAFSLLYVVIVLASVRLRSRRATIALAAAASVLSLMDVAFSTASEAPMWAVWTNRGLSLLAIWSTALIGAWLTREERKRAEAQRTLDQTTRELQRSAAAERELRTETARLTERVAMHAEDAQLVESGLRRTAESVSKQLQKKEALLAAILDTAAEAIITIGTDGRIESFNRAAERMFGWTAEEICGQNVSLLMPAPASLDHDTHIQHYLVTRQPRVVGIGREVIGKRKNGTTFPLNLSLSEVQVNGDHKFTGIMRDLTERQRLEDQFHQAQKMEAIGRLAAGVAHEFNNLLMGVIGVIGLARKACAKEPEAAALLDEAKDAAQRGASLSRHLLDFSRQEPAQLVPLELNDVVRSTERMLRQVIGEDVRIEVDLSPGGAPILGDAQRMQQILLNLTVNARDAMPRGGRLRIATREVELAEPRHARNRMLQPGRYVALDLEDSGCGMNPSVQARVFEPFFTTKEPGTGTGLGLYAVYGIVEQFSGGIDLTSEVGRGTKFTIHFPWCATAAPRPAAPAIAGSEPMARGKETILVAEDDRLIRVTLRHTLSAMGYTVLAAGDVEEALRIAAQHAGPINLLLTDMVLPGGTGDELARKLSAKRPGVRVLVMSAYPADVLVKQGRIEPGARTLEKPFSDEALASCVHEALSAAGAAH